MLARRVVVCLDVKGSRVVKGTRFESLRDVGDPVALAARYEAGGADEIVFLDISASAEERATLLDMVRCTAERLFIPLTVGGGVRSVEDVRRVLQAGADKVSINSAAVQRPALLGECAARFGAQCVVASIDARREASDMGNTGSSEAHGPRHGQGEGEGEGDGRDAPGDGQQPVWRVSTRGGRHATDIDAVAWARECGERGAGEILLTSIDRDGVRGGYDLELTRAVSAAVNVPVVASGGAGSTADVVEVLRDGGADAALVAGILHDGLTTVAEIKEAMRLGGLPVRMAA